MLKKIAKILGIQKEQAEESAVETGQEVPTIPIAQQPDTLKTEPAPGPTSDLPQLVFGCAQSVGRVRDHNEDSILVFSTLLTNNGTYTPIGLFIVADGMGGHKQGEVASGLAVRIVAREVLQKVMLGLMDAHPTPPQEGGQEILQASVMAAHRSITKEAPGSGTTLTAVLILDKFMSIAHVGDSRAYLISPKGEIDVITRDHTLVKRMMELGHLTEEEASTHPQRNVLYRALGQGEPFSPDVSTTPVPSDSLLLICSDGLWGMVPQSEILQVIESTPDLERACQILVNAANAAGGTDNISAILVRLPEYED